MLPAAHFRRSLELLRDREQAYAWALRDTQLGPYLALEGVPRQIDWTGQSGHQTLALLDFHICYSHSYQVPIMCFRAAALDGQPLPGDVMAELFQTWPRQRERLLGFVTQQEHPLLPGPCWHVLHPCNTGAVLALALGLEADQARPAAAPPAPPGMAGPAGAPSAGGGRAAPPDPARLAPQPALPPGAAAARGADADGGAVAAAPGAGSAGRRMRAKQRVEDAGSGTSCGAPQLPGGGAPFPEDDGVPDLDQLLLCLGAGVQGGAADPCVGPAGVAWPGGEVPVCPGSELWLARYMRAWFSLVCPHVGLLEGRARGPDAVAVGG